MYELENIYQKLVGQYGDESFIRNYSEDEGLEELDFIDILDERPGVSWILGKNQIQGFYDDGTSSVNPVDDEQGFFDYIRKGIIKISNKTLEEISND